MILNDGDREVLIYIGQSIRNYRKTKEMSISKLAAIADIDPTYLIRIEKGANLSVVVLCRILNGLRIGIEDVMPVEYFRLHKSSTESGSKINDK